MRNLVQATLFEVLAHLAAVDPVFWRVNAEDFTEKLQSAFPVSVKIRQHFSHVEMALGAETARIQDEVARDRNTGNCAPMFRPLPRL